jgi:protein tyrosine/serine phosphatase
MSQTLRFHDCPSIGLSPSFVRQEWPLPEILKIKNFHQVNDWLYRSGQPQPEEFVEIENFGIKSIVSLRWSSDIIRKERKLVESTKMNLYCIPLSYWILPTRKEIDKFLSIVDETANHPILVHCFHGSDRTGMFIAMYRMAREGWSADAAYEEMKSCGFHRLRMRQFKWAIYSFAERLERARRRRSPS